MENECLVGNLESIWFKKIREGSGGFPHEHIFNCYVVLLRSAHWTALILQVRANVLIVSGHRDLPVLVRMSYSVSRDLLLQLELLLGCLC